MRVKKVLMIIGVLLLIFSSNFFEVKASEEEINENKGQLKIVLDGPNINLENIEMKLHLYRIKNIINLDKMTFEFIDECKELENIDNIYNENQIEYVNEVKKFVQNNNIKEITYNVKYGDLINISDLNYGEYLVVIDDFIVDGKKYECNYFLVSMPVEGNDNINDSITVNPKFSEFHENLVTPKPEKPTESLPNTGIIVIPAIVCALFGILLIVIGCLLDRKGKKLEK